MYIPHDRVHPAQGGPSRTKQSMQDECDINKLMKRYEKTGLIDHVNRHQGQYGNFVTGEDYHGHLTQVLAAQAAFGTLPSAIRARFDNDPASFLNFVQNPENEAEMIKMGLAEGRPPPPKEQPSENVGDAPQPSPTTPVDPSEGANPAPSQASTPSAT